ncbi:Bcr/CflA family efflux MFS transporter [Slackia heliotrinireducens]|uniref:Drug resistance transporter, Bcr/CflA subfamily n=1 Tax=Slackia heliotrinireducens (strain ATCC 29202 / DSM 20476 / NCTC 11029 / RHS 1) TaxID=471855 RepID=C7N8A6_SLAHD|nr:Bcr/CflA family efflux MFS transporter [Slackia heliotrinireducens]ACV23141.1 drug resistance transporter, Bcr/CflA subfamily [Slackia heliotrinireducens DSM 20476]VEH02180.1 Sulfonamide resistance protein [Slackia heliotrinireducens]
MGATDKKTDLLIDQPMGKVMLIVFITLLSVFPPLATDMYMPSLPELREDLGTSSAVASASIIAFFFMFGVGQLLFGTISDKFGRKPILLAGLGVFVASSIGCALAPNIAVLLALRALQGLGGGAGGAIAMAITKDCFPEERRARVLIVTQAAGALGPVVAPVIGGWISTFATWRVVFWVLAGTGLAAFALAIVYRESNPPEMRYTGSLAGNFGRLAVVARNKGFTLLLVTLALVSAPFMGYVTTSSYVYMDFFGLSSGAYSLFFAGTALIMVAAPFVYLIVSRYFKTKTLIEATMVGAFVFAGLMLLFAKRSPWMFVLTIAPFLMMSSAIRPGTTNVLLMQHETDTGSASSLINFTFTAFGSLGSVVAALSWPDFVTADAGTILVFFTAAVALWVVLLKSPYPVRGVK